MKALLTAIFYQPLYNGLIFLMHILPWADAGIVIILFTFIVRLILFPLSKKAVETQLQMKKLEPHLNALKEKHKDDRAAHAQATMQLYKEKGVNPFSSFLLLIIQIPIVFALYRIFLKSGLPLVDQKLLYSFVAHSAKVANNMYFLGLVDISHKSFWLALLAAITSFIQIRFSVPPIPTKANNPSLRDDLARSMNLQMRFMFPVIMFFIAYSISGAIALYLITTNVFTIGQELYVRRKMRRESNA
ncbi:YidC/Oxa1 family membrane protein insertase [Candidatus Parcubacteria bacterium]|nr:YidC/Oxa1 family membrane protein insertase [Candidatus Parcubacteria bacterium]